MKEKELINNLFDELFPIMRSITGPGLEESINIFKRYIPLEISHVTTGTKVFDWTVPKEWHFTRARLTDPDGEIVCDTKDLNLHVVNYSESVDKVINLDELQNYLHSNPKLPDAVPYVTSYYKKNWGFCLTQRKRDSLKPGGYHALIESKFVDGGVPFAQYTLCGESKREILLSSYLCHPSLANNELSGPLVLLGLYNRIKSWKRRRFSYRFLLNPETIGSLCFLHKHAKELKENLESGLILTCLGGPSKRLIYKSSRNKHSIINKVMAYDKKNTLLPIQMIPFSPLNGSDERQYCSPGFNFPIGQVSRTTYGNYDGYHNSFDNKEFMGIDRLLESIETLEQMLKYLEVCGNPVNLSPFGEPQLGKRDLYPNINSNTTRNLSSDQYIDGRIQLNRILTILNMADGNYSLIDIAEALDSTVDEIHSVVEKLEEKELIKYNVKPPTL